MQSAQCNNSRKNSFCFCLEKFCLKKLLKNKEVNFNKKIFSKKYLPFTFYSLEKFLFSETYLEKDDKNLKKNTATTTRFTI